MANQSQKSGDEGRIYLSRRVYSAKYAILEEEAESRASRLLGMVAADGDGDG